MYVAKGCLAQREHLSTLGAIIWRMLNVLTLVIIVLSSKYIRVVLRNTMYFRQAVNLSLKALDGLMNVLWLG